MRFPWYSFPPPATAKPRAVEKSAAAIYPSKLLYRRRPYRKSSPFSTFRGAPSARIDGYAPHPESVRLRLKTAETCRHQSAADWQGEDDVSDHSPGTHFRPR